jgi:hypothetical protein
MTRQALQLLKQTIVWLRELVKVAPDVTQALRLALNERTLLLVRLGRLADAEAACRESLSLFLPGLPVDAAVEDIASFAVPPDAHHDLGTTLSLLADLRRLQGHPREARLLVATALQIAEQCQGDGSIDVCVMRGGALAEAHDDGVCVAVCLAVCLAVCVLCVSCAVAINPLVANTIRQLVRLDQGPEECIDLCERCDTPRHAMNKATGGLQSWCVESLSGCSWMLFDVAGRAVRLWRDEPKGGPSASLSMMLLSWAMALQKAGRDDEADVSLTEVRRIHTHNTRTHAHTHPHSTHTRIRRTRKGRACWWRC